MAKTALYDAMREEGVGRAELVRRLRCHLPEVSRLFDLRYASGWSTSKRLSPRSGRSYRRCGDPHSLQEQPHRRLLGTVVTGYRRLVSG